MIALITLNQFPPTYGLPNASPFCMKVENYLRLAGLPYRSAYGFELRKAPKGKLPFIEDNGRLIADSGLIFEYLRATYSDTLDGHLSHRERAVSVSFTRLLDEHLYWVACVQPRWVETAGWQITRAAFFHELSGPLGALIPFVARHNIRKQMRGTGLLRHDTEEIYAMAMADITAVADYLGERPFFHGERPSSIDATVYAHLANIMVPPIDSPARRHALSLSQLAAYCERMRDACYGDDAK